MPVYTGVSAKILYTFLTCPKQCVHPAQHSLLNYVTVTQHKTTNVLHKLCHCTISLVTSHLLHICSEIHLFYPLGLLRVWKTRDVCCYLLFLSQNVSGRIIDFYILIFKVLENQTFTFAVNINLHFQNVLIWYCDNISPFSVFRIKWGFQVPSCNLYRQ